MNDTTVLILAAGGGERWNGPKFKSMFEAEDDEPNIVRTVRMCKELLDKDAIVVTHVQQDILHVSAEHFTVFCIPSYWSICSTLLSTKPLWAKTTIVLLGDVHYSEWTLKRLLAGDENLFIGSRTDLYALRLDGNDPELPKCLDKVIARARSLSNPHRAKLWALYRLMHGAAFDSEENMQPLDHTDFIMDHSGTQDFDFYEDYLVWHSGLA